MTVRVERVDDHILIFSEFRDKESCKSIPGSAWKREYKAWAVPLSWASCIALRSTFGERLEIGPALTTWAQGLVDTCIKPAMDLREALTAEWVLGTDERLFPHQHAGVRFMQAARSSLIADEMGTGKTAQAITTTGLAGAFPCLIICPNSVVRNWENEFRMWWPEAEVRVLKGGRQKIVKAIADVRDGEADVAVINWEAMMRYSRLAPYGNVKLAEGEKVPKELNQVKWQCVIADEAHNMIHPKNKSTRAVWAISQQDSVVMRHALTGTPMANAPDDLWGILHFVDPSEFPARSKYVDRFCMVSWNQWGGLDVVGVRPEMRDEWEKVVHPRMRSIPIDLVRNLPDVVREVRYVEMAAKQRKAYQQMEEVMAARLENGDVIITTNPIAQLVRLSQFASSYAEVEEDRVKLTEPSNKLDELETILDETGDQPVVVFAVSRQLIMLAAARLTKKGVTYALMIGGQNDGERQLAVDRFQGGKVRVILCTLGAGSVGITLTRGRIAVFLQRSWRMIDNVQAEGRIRRIGSEHHPSIAVIDVVSEHTVDERRIEVNEIKTERLEDIVQRKDILLRLLGRKT